MSVTYQIHDVSHLPDTWCESLTRYTMSVTYQVQCVTYLEGTMSLIYQVQYVTYLPGMIRHSLTRFYFIVSPNFRNCFEDVPVRQETVETATVIMRILPRLEKNKKRKMVRDFNFLRHVLRIKFQEYVLAFIRPNLCFYEN